VSIAWSGYVMHDPNPASVEDVLLAAIGVGPLALDKQTGYDDLVKESL